MTQLIKIEKNQIRRNAMHMTLLEGEHNVEYITSIDRIGMARGMQKGMLKGIQTGIQKGEAVVLIRQLEHRFGYLPDIFRQKIQEANNEFLLMLEEKVIDVNNLDDLFEI